MASILLVDDNQTLRTAYSTFLEHSGHQVTVMSTVGEALTYLATNTPDVILLDMLLPKVNGLELLQQYDIRTAHPNVKVIVFSNLAESQIKQEAEDLGVHLYLNKAHMTPEDLTNAVQSVLAR